MRGQNATRGYVSVSGARDDCWKSVEKHTSSRGMDLILRALPKFCSLGQVEKIGIWIWMLLCTLTIRTTHVYKVGSHVNFSKHSALFSCLTLTVDSISCHAGYMSLKDAVTSVLICHILLNMSYGQIIERREVSVLCCVGVNYNLSELHQVFFGTGSHSAVSAPATGLFLSHWCGQTAVHIPMVAKNMKTLLHALWIPS